MLSSAFLTISVSAFFSGVNLDCLGIITVLPVILFRAVKLLFVPVFELFFGVSTALSVLVFFASSGFDASGLAGFGFSGSTGFDGSTSPGFGFSGSAGFDSSFVPCLKLNSKFFIAFSKSAFALSTASCLTFVSPSTDFAVFIAVSNDSTAADVVHFSDGTISLPSTLILMFFFDASATLIVFLSSDLSTTIFSLVWYTYSITLSLLVIVFLTSSCGLM